MFGQSVAATKEERSRALPGDHAVPGAMGVVMHAVTIDAPPAAVWPWLAQMGAGRAGWYSYDFVDNDGLPSATTIIDRLQDIAPGDVMPALPGANDAFIIDTFEPPSDLLLVVPAASGGNLVSWEFLLEPLGEARTRLLVRARVARDWPGGGAGPAPVKRRPIEWVYALLGMMPNAIMRPVASFGHAIMQRRQLIGIKRRAENLCREGRTNDIWMD